MLLCSKLRASFVYVCFALQNISTNHRRLWRQGHVGGDKLRMCEITCWRYFKNSSTSSTRESVVIRKFLLYRSSDATPFQMFYHHKSVRPCRFIPAALLFSNEKSLFSMPSVFSEYGYAFARLIQESSCSASLRKFYTARLFREVVELATKQLQG